MIQDISWYQTRTNQWVSQMWIWLLIAINVFFLSVQNVEDTDLWGYFFWSVYYVRGHRSEGTYILEDIDLSNDIRGHRFEEICFWKDIDLGVTSEDKALEGHGSEYDVMIGHRYEGRTRIWVLHIQCILYIQ